MDIDDAKKMQPIYSSIIIISFACLFAIYEIDTDKLAWTQTASQSIFCFTMSFGSCLYYLTLYPGMYAHFCQKRQFKALVHLTEAFTFIGFSMFLFKPGSLAPRFISVAYVLSMGGWIKFRSDYEKKRLQDELKAAEETIKALEEAIDQEDLIYKERGWDENTHYMFM